MKILKEFWKIKCVTKTPHPILSPDYLDPAGSIEDNNTCTYFIYEIDKFTDGMPYFLMDIGCAGGQFAVDINNKGIPWMGVGIEGGNIYGMTTEFESKECHTGVLTSARGSENWRQYENKCLFHADVSKPFQIVDENDNQVMFDIVTAWEFFEHPTPEEIPNIIKNIKTHLRPGGVVWGTIHLGTGFHHRCSKSIEWWDNVFISYGFSVHKYPFQTSPRTNVQYYSMRRQAIEKITGKHEREMDNIVHYVDQSVAPFDDSLNLNVYPFCYVLEKS